MLSCTSNQSPQTVAHPPAESTPNLVQESPTPVQSATIQQAEVITKIGNIRTERSLKSDILIALPQHSWVEVLEARDKWLYVKTRNGKLGWLNRNATKMLTPIGRTPSYSGSGSRGYPRTGSDEIPNGRELYDEVQGLKSRDGLTDREAVRKILRDMGEIK